jgi:hypothetical protein
VPYVPQMAVIGILIFLIYCEYASLFKKYVNNKYVQVTLYPMVET